MIDCTLWNVYARYKNRKRQIVANLFPRHLVMNKTMNNSKEIRLAFHNEMKTPEERSLYFLILLGSYLPSHHCFDLGPIQNLEWRSYHESCSLTICQKFFYDEKSFLTN